MYPNRCILLISLLSLLPVAKATSSFTDTLLGRLRPSDNNFPFLQSDTSTRVFVFPNGEQMLKLQSDALQPGAVNRNDDFNNFDTYRRVLSDFLILEYDEREPMDMPVDILLRKQAYSFVAMIVPQSDVDSLANMVSTLTPTRSDRNAIIDLPRAEIAQEIRNCRREQIGNTGYSDFKTPRSDVTEITRYRVSCRKIKDTMFMAIGTVYLMYERNLSEADERFIRDRMSEYSDFMLRKKVSSLFDYPYKLISPQEYWKNPTTVAPPGRPIHGEMPRRSETIEGNVSVYMPEMVFKKKAFRGGLDVDQEIIVLGTPTDEKDERFSVNLADDNRNIYLHIAVRFDEKKVVLNTFSQGGWGDEERIDDFPFRNKTPFVLKIKCTETGYDLHVNGRIFTNYKRRLDPKKVTMVWIYGDIIDTAVADIL